MYTIVVTLIYKTQNCFVTVENVSESQLTDDEWVTIREFSDCADGGPLPRYEAKCVGDVDKAYLDDELVLLKEIRPGGYERTYHVPTEVVSDIAERLPT